MHPQKTVVWTMVWLSGLVGTFATRISPPLSDDQYSPQLPENCHEVERRLKVLGHRKMWRTWQNRTETPIFSNSGAETVRDTSDKIPLRGAIAIANADVTDLTTTNKIRHSVDKKSALGSKKNLGKLLTSKSHYLSSNIDHEIGIKSNRYRPIVKRETIDFTSSINFPYYKIPDDPSIKKPRVDKHKERNGMIKNSKRNWNQRFNNRSQKEYVQGYSDGYRKDPSATINSELEKKLQNYIRKITPIDVRDDRHLYSSFNSEYPRRNNSSNFYPKYIYETTQRPIDNQSRHHFGQQLSRGGTHEPHDLRLIQNVKDYGSSLNHEPMTQHKQQNNHPTSLVEKSFNPSHITRPYRSFTEGRIERISLNNNSQNNQPVASTENPRHLSNFKNEDKQDDYVRRITPVDVRHRLNRQRIKPYLIQVGTNRSVSGNVSDKIESPRMQSFSFKPVEDIPQGHRSFKTIHTTLDEKDKTRASNYPDQSISNKEDEQASVTNQHRLPGRKTRYQHFRGLPGFQNAADNRYQNAQISARVYITPSVYQNRFKRNINNVKRI